MRKRLFPLTGILLFLLSTLLLSCGDAADDTGLIEEKQSQGFQCSEDNGSLTLPEGFCAGVVADNLGIVRHIAVHDNGTIFVSQRHRNLNVGGLLTLEDEDGDGRMEKVSRFSDQPGMGIGLFGDYLYFASDAQLFRFRLSQEDGLPQLPSETIVKQFPYQLQHSGRAFALDKKGDIYVNIGAKSNACQEEDRKVGSLGVDPCPELQRHAGIWRFKGDELLQDFSQGMRYASGVRNAYALDWHPELDTLFLTQHGRDQLHELWPRRYSVEDGQHLPAEEFLKIKEGRFYGWPYCYFDQIQDKHFLAPEYGGDGEQVGRCKSLEKPIIAFPGHFGPSDLVFYQGEMFPDSYQGGAFIAFHGAYYKSKSELEGLQVIFIARQGESFAPDWQVFADHFAGDTSNVSPLDAEYRPVSVAVGADGSLYFADSVQGRIWRVIYNGQ